MRSNSNIVNLSRCIDCWKFYYLQFLLPSINRHICHPLGKCCIYIFDFTRLLPLIQVLFVIKVCYRIFANFYCHLMLDKIGYYTREVDFGGELANIVRSFQR